MLIFSARFATLQVCDAFATPHWTREVGVVFDAADDLGFLPGDMIDWPTYITRQRDSNAWGGEREMSMIQELLNVRLVVYDLDKEVRHAHCGMLLTDCSVNVLSGLLE